MDREKSPGQATFTVKKVTDFPVPSRDEDGKIDNFFYSVVQYLSNMRHGQNLSSTSGEPEFVAQSCFEIPASG
jgi:hypothetical protein